MPVEELNRLELEFLGYNQFNIYVSLEELQQYGDQLLMHSIREQQLLLKKEKLLLDQSTTTSSASIYSSPKVTATTNIL